MKLMKLVSLLGEKVLWSTWEDSRCRTFFYNHHIADVYLTEDRISVDRIIINKNIFFPYEVSNGRRQTFEIEGNFEEGLGLIFPEMTKLGREIL